MDYSFVDDSQLFEIQPALWLERKIDWFVVELLAILDQTAYHHQFHQSTLHAEEQSLDYC